MVGAVADRAYRRVGGATAFIDLDAVVAGQAGVLRQAVVRQHADAEDHHISRERTRRRDDRTHPSLGIPLEGERPRAKSDVHAAARMLRLVPARYRFGDDAVHHPFGDFEHRDFEPELPKGCGDLEPDVAAAQDHRPSSRAIQGAQRIGPQCIRIRDAAKHMDCAQVDAGQRQRAGAAAGGKHQGVVRVCAAVRQPDLPRAALETGHGLAKVQIDFLFSVERRLAQLQAIDRQSARQVLLGERGALVGQPGLLAEDRDRAAIAATPQCLDELRCGLSGAHDHHIAKIRHRHGPG